MEKGGLEREGRRVVRKGVVLGESSLGEKKRGGEILWEIVGILEMVENSENVGKRLVE